MSDVDECAGDPCGPNSVSCSDGVNDFKCDCEQGFTGQMCEQGQCEHSAFFRLVRSIHLRFFSQLLVISIHAKMEAVAFLTTLVVSACVYQHSQELFVTRVCACGISCLLALALL